MAPGATQADRAADVGAVVARLRGLVTALPAQDGVAAFATAYLTVTEALAGHLAAGGYFKNPDGVARLDVLFAGRFLDALTARRPPACWRPLLQLRLHPGVLPVQFALCGMNAHIEHDLPLAVVDACTLLGCSPEELSGDFHRVNDLLAQVEEEVRDRLMPVVDGELAVAEPLLHLLSAWSIERARDAAWASAATLWELRDRPDAYRVAAEALDDATGLVCRCLLTPLGALGALGTG
ncbi:MULTISPECIES: DUF5995 family protein [Streptacidiphilus]|uniref:DUF5995 family protein n=1 Tax=Streptacidiphilus cavernicola TaxID=3342716 RepID=A0ABV6UT65_9ACTN|nr:DUF5995 family protein [Streptacidiphilus jeojiense]